MRSSLSWAPIHGAGQGGDWQAEGAVCQISSEQVNLYNCGIYLYIRIYKHERVTKV